VVATVFLALSGFLALTFTAPTARATDGVVKDMTFLLHSVNATETARPLPGGGSTLTYFDTTLQFNSTEVKVLVSGTVKVLQWFLSPALAGNFSADGYTFRIWANSSTSASSNAQVSLQVFELNATGVSTQVDFLNLGSVSFPVTPTLEAWSHTFSASHTFLPGSSIEVRATVTPGVNQGVWFHYDTAQYNSRVSFHGPDSLNVSQIATLDSSGTPTASFSPSAANKTMYLQAHVTDPLGGYDIRWVNLTLTSPSGTVLLDNVSMAQISGTPIGFESVFQVVWNYSGQPNGPYTVLVWALDNNGHNFYSFFQQYTYDSYPDAATAVFYVGSPPFYAWIEVVDSLGLPLEQARVSLASGGSPVASGTTDARGMVNLTAFGGSYTVSVVWASVVVAQVPLALTANISEADPFVVNAAVYYPAVHTVDASGIALANAAVYLTYPNGTTAVLPVFTNATGDALLGRLPGGSLGLRVLWRGVQVADVSTTVGANAPPPIAIPCAVYYLTVTVSDSRSVPLADAQVVLSDAVYGLVADAQITDANGRTVSRLPVGTYAIDVTWNGVAVSTGTTVQVNANGNQAVLAKVYYLTVSAVDSRSKPVPGAQVVALSASGRIFTSALSDANGQAVVRVPGTTVLLQATWLGVPVGSMSVPVSSDATVAFPLEVYTLNVTVRDANGAPLQGAQVTVESGGRVFALEVTDASGAIAIRLPIGDYTVRARFTASYLYTFVDASDETTVALSQDTAKTLQLGAYPPPFTSTVAFGWILSLIVVAVVLSFVFYLLGKRRASRPAAPEAPKEPEKPEQGGGPP